MKNQKILVVEDDRKTAELIKLYLLKEGFRVCIAFDGKTALEKIATERFDLVILDIMLPEVDGLYICNTIREESDMAIIMLTARSTEQDRLMGLDGGADDYVVKPFSPRELIARVKAVLRRLPDAYFRRGPAIIRRGNLVIDFVKRQTLSDNRIIELTPVEFKILGYLMREPGRVFEREQLAVAAYGLDYEGFDRTIDVHISNIRKKLCGEIDVSKGTLFEHDKSGENSKKRYHQYIQTVFGVGYKFNPDIM